MTKDQADARAQQLWGPLGVATVTMQAGGVLVTTERGRLRYHRMDSDGHVTCHNDCKKFEKYLDMERTR